MITAHPYPLLPFPVVVINGFGSIILSNIQAPYNQTIIYVIVNLAVTGMIGLVFSTTMMFLFRYLQTTQSPYLRIASDMRYCALAYLVVGVINVALIYVPLNWQLLNNEELKQGIEKANPDVYERMKNRYSTGFSVGLFGDCAKSVNFVFIF
jgi:hypothetical protein